MTSGYVRAERVGVERWVATPTGISQSWAGCRKPLLGAGWAISLAPCMNTHMHRSFITSSQVGLAVRQAQHSAYNYVYMTVHMQAP